MFILLDNPFDHYDLSIPLFPILESKSLTTLDAGQDDIRQAVIDAGFKMDPTGWKTNRRAESSKYKKSFDRLQNRIRGGILSYVRSFQEGKISLRRWSNWTRHLIRDGYQQAFRLGLLSAGVKAAQADVADFDRSWVATASKHEMRYLNVLLKQIAEGKQKGSVEKRLAAYVEALKNVFYSGRVMGTPSNHLIEWVGPNDRTTCKSCRFLIEKSPYTKQSLPTTPKAGDTKCLNNCRCRLIMREVDKNVFDTVQGRHKSKRWYSDKLSRIKAGKVL